MPSRSAQLVVQLLDTRSIAQLPDIKAALGGVSRATAFRYLAQVQYRRSYNCNGRYYSRHDPARYDRLGLWCHQGVCFSRDGTLGATITRLVRESDQGWTHRELQALLHVRVQTFLLEAVASATLAREQVDGSYVYLHVDRAVRQSQLRRRNERIASGKAVVATGALVVDDSIVIQILLVLIRHPGSKAADVVRRLRGHLPPITFEQVRAVFSRYDLEDLGEKGGPSSC